MVEYDKSYHLDITRCDITCIMFRIFIQSVSDFPTLPRWGPPQGFWGSGEKGYLFSGSWGALLIILGELGSKHKLLGI